LTEGMLTAARFLVALLAFAILAVAAWLLLAPRPSNEPAASNRTAATEPSARTGAAPGLPIPTGPADLGAALGLASLAECRPGTALASILEQMVRTDSRTFESRRGGPISVPGHAQPLVPTFERRREVEGNADIREVTADLALTGRWHGLAVNGLRRSFFEESDVSSFEIRFAEPPQRVRETLVRHGFRLPTVGDFADVGEGEEISAAIAVERREGGASLICAIG
jgi:hypothetical protein